MSKVEWKTLRDVCCFKKGQMITLKTAIKGSVPVISSGQQPSFYHNCANRNGETIVVAGSGAYAGFVSYWDTPIFVADAFSVSPKNLQTIIVKYLFYYLQNNQETIYHTKTTGGIPHVYSRFIENYIIPIPPKHIQQQIVNQLDIFTTLIAKLESELTLRQKQYEFYREELLNFDGDEEVEWKTIKTICYSICSGGTPPTKRPDFYNGDIPWLRTQEVDFNDVYDTAIKITEEAIKSSSAKLIDKNCVIIAMYGATAAKCCINKIRLATNQACCNLNIDSEIAVYKYVFYYLCKEYFNLKALGEGSQYNINSEKIKNYPIPIPSKHRQQQIVSQLDTFTTLIDKLKREIALRQKQYEFYREKLLTFE